MGNLTFFVASFVFGFVLLWAMAFLIARKDFSYIFAIIFGFVYFVIALLFWTIYVANDSLFTYFGIIYYLVAFGVYSIIIMLINSYKKSI
ncbi:MAG: hypothetical protein K0S34_800 [Bacillales bacterium]|jgi:hypothetical protein|nr:hypothetical protein [Bacillales bacterium]